jgi:hypothetical protein
MGTEIKGCRVLTVDFQYSDMLARLVEHLNGSFSLVLEDVLVRCVASVKIVDVQLVSPRSLAFACKSSMAAKDTPLW